MKHRISIPATADRFYYESKDTDTVWDMMKMLENKLQVTHPFISLYLDHYMLDKLGYGCYYTKIDAFSVGKWYVKVEPDHVKLCDKKYARDEGDKIVYDFSDFEEVVDDHFLSNVLSQVSRYNKKNENRDVEIHLSASEPRIDQLVREVLPKLVYSYHITNEMGEVFKVIPSYYVVAISIDQTEKKLTDDLLKRVKEIIQHVNGEDNLKKIVLSL